jgi:putative ABC transport system ATP-binding protein
VKLLGRFTPTTDSDAGSALTGTDSAERTATRSPQVDGEGMGRAVLELRQVVKEYPGSPPVRALDGIDLRIEQGELVAIVGPSGSGKSTLLNIMGALDRPTTGEVLIDGISLRGLPDGRISAVRGRHLGFVFQQFHLLDGLNAVDNVATGTLYQGTPTPERRAEAEEMLNRVGLGHRLDHRPGKLSGGERQRVAIARALLGSPSILLADEPTGNLDSRTSAAIVELFHDLHSQGTTIVIITHDAELAANLPRAVTILDGQLQSDRRQDTEGTQNRAALPAVQPVEEAEPEPAAAPQDSDPDDSDPQDSDPDDSDPDDSDPQDR